MPQLSPKLAQQGLLVEVNEGEDLELSVVIEAYPNIIEHKWHTPASTTTSTQEHRFIQFNNRYDRLLSQTKESLCNSWLFFAWVSKKESSVVREEKVLRMHFG